MNYSIALQRQGTPIASQALGSYYGITGTTSFLYQPLRSTCSFFSTIILAPINASSFSPLVFHEDIYDIYC